MTTPHRVGLLIPAALAFGLCLSSGCGDNAPTAPTGTTQNPTSLNLTGPDYLFISESGDYKLEATYADGRREPMTAASWGCDNPGAVQMANGRATGMASGEATVYSDCQHGRATHRVRVVPDYRGSWSGAYIWRSCSASGEFDAIDACEMFSVGSELPLLIRLSQNRDQTTGTLAFGDLMGDVTGVVDIPGHLALRGSMRYDVEGIAVTITVDGWDTVAEGDRMSGRFRQVWTIAGASGSMTSECEFRSVSRSSRSIQGLARQPGAPARGLRELLLRLGGR